MKSLFSKSLRLLTRLVLSKATIARRALLRTEAREREANEDERLDRLRNPRAYLGK